MHVGKVELLLAFLLEYLTVLAPEESVAPVLAAPFHILLGRHHDRCGEISVSEAGADDIAVDGVVVDDIIFDAVGALQVHDALVEIVIGDRSRPLYLPPRMQAVGRHGSPARHRCDEQP